MKTKKNTLKLTLNKTTIVSLGHEQQGAVKGGYLATNLFWGCNTWNPICPTLPAGPCPILTNKII